ncbi:DNA topoisomerase 3 [uncultured Umboniibacter sp.]|uniref:DNA topoisomerase 3 n=1 Tax=uncultured Umboniibacter sp. TaxID=1798917 RepID=UPI002615621F|nr:DNA topoisomerase 3 [uncultured Umboniibacter sp.]
MKVYIAEKPSLAKKIAAALGGGRQGGGFIQGDAWVVTWAIGHLFELLPPEGYDPALKAWRRETLPILPDPFQLSPKEGTLKQLKVVLSLIKSATTVVNAGDPDREGQLLIDDIIEHSKYAGQVERLWLIDLTEKGIRKALTSMSPNREFFGLSQSADARRKADWTVGMNLTRAATIAARARGAQQLFSVGRVQTPTLALVVKRDREVEAFRPTDHFGVKATFQFPLDDDTLTDIPSQWQIPESELDEHGRLLQQSVASTLIQRVEGQPAVVTSCEQTPKRELAPLPYSLSALQAHASKAYGMGAQETLDVAQSLYEKHQATTYPRTDCGYLEENKLDEVQEILATIGQINEHFKSLVDAIVITDKPRCFNDKKVTAHTAIIPTANNPDVSKFSKAEKQVYWLICRRFASQFYPAHAYLQTTILIECASETFKATGRSVTEEGWKRFTRSEGESDEANEDEAILSPVNPGAIGQNIETELLKKQTKKPSRYTEGTLISAMANISKTVASGSVKATLREIDGLGTEATRAGIIELLKKRSFISPSGKNIISTDAGRALIEALPREVTDPSETAIWEQGLALIAEGKLRGDQFFDKQCQWLKAMLKRFDTEFNISTENLYESCPECQSGSLVPRKGEYGDFLACNNEDCKFTRNSGKKAVKGLSKKHQCAECESPLIKRKTNDRNWWGCSGYPKCKTTYFDNNGLPAIPSPDYDCRDCGSPLIRKRSKKTEQRAAVTYWSCSNYPECKTSYFEKGTKPDYAGAK